MPRMKKAERERREKAEKLREQLRGIVRVVYDIPFDFPEVGLQAQEAVIALTNLSRAICAEPAKTVGTIEKKVKDIVRESFYPPPKE